MIDLDKEYDYYINNESMDGMPISVETAKFMYYLCNQCKFKTLMDRGSGFSSFILRLYASEQDFPVDVFSIDTDPDWIEKTKAYLDLRNLNTDNFYIWDDFYRNRKDIRFDFILEDAKFELRITTYNQFIKLINADGVILWDDANHNSHKPIILSCAKELGFKVIDIKNLTVDKFGRCSTLTTNRQIDLGV